MSYIQPNCFISDMKKIIFTYLKYLELITKLDNIAKLTDNSSDSSTQTM